jgi:hypothetical protein
VLKRAHGDGGCTHDRAHGALQQSHAHQHGGYVLDQTHLARLADRTGDALDRHRSRVLSRGHQCKPTRRRARELAQVVALVTSSTGATPRASSPVLGARGTAGAPRRVQVGRVRGRHIPLVRAVVARVGHGLESEAERDAPGES